MSVKTALAQRSEADRIAANPSPMKITVAINCEGEAEASHGLSPERGARSRHPAIPNLRDAASSNK